MNQMSFPARWRSVATAVAVTLTLTLSAGAGCDSRRDPPVPSVRDKLEKSQIFGRAKLRIGVAGDQPLMSYQDKDGRFSGFDIEMAKYLAASLGYRGEGRIEFVPLSTGDRIMALQASQVDMVVASLSITEERRKHVALAGPYLVTQQKVMIPVALKGRITTIEDLRDPAYKVCVSGGSTTEQELKRREIRALVVDNVRDCAEGLRAGRYHAFSSDETILAGFYAEHPTDFEIIKLPFGATEQLGVGVPITDPDLAELVAYFLDKSFREGEKKGTSPWLTAYNTTVGPWLHLEPPRRAQQPKPLGVPTLTDFEDKAPTR